MTREEFPIREKERAGRRVNITLVSANLLRWLGGLSSIPGEVIEAVQAVLAKAKEKDEIRDFRVYALGSDLHLQVNTLGQGWRSLKAHQLAYEAAAASLARASDSGLYRPMERQDFFQLPLFERFVALRLRPLDFPFTERGSEPIYVAKLINGSVGSFNRMLYNLFFPPAKGSHPRLDGTRFVAIVEKAADLLAGKKQRRLFSVGDRPAG